MRFKKKKIFFDLGDLRGRRGQKSSIFQEAQFFFRQNGSNPPKIFQQTSWRWLKAGQTVKKRCRTTFFEIEKYEFDFWIQRRI